MTSRGLSQNHMLNICKVLPSSQFSKVSFVHCLLLNWQQIDRNWKFSHAAGFYSLYQKSWQRWNCVSVSHCVAKNTAWDVYCSESKCVRHSDENIWAKMYKVISAFNGPDHFSFEKDSKIFRSFVRLQLKPRAEQMNILLWIIPSNSACYVCLHNQPPDQINRKQ